jgi:hypothetical protein
MKTPRKIAHRFVDEVPKDREEGVLYISIPYTTAVHSCLCGCGSKVVTPLSPVGWQMLFDGETVSLFPSIGNWGFACRSHYIIRRDQALPAGEMSKRQIARGRERDRTNRDVFFETGQLPPVDEPSQKTKKIKKGLLQRLLDGGS